MKKTFFLIIILFSIVNCYCQKAKDYFDKGLLKIDNKTFMEL